ncbi:MAG: NAD(P) transhydrogenase subunit beta, NAD(P) transhydrogenase subunit beta [Chloroflexi bacterium CSP1-4]|nr:MAG: NAD(P) transhydrogenase subunit beta, NAD(P) transhydrogenase subunit beta [Chloroflexi bacterium CSP1-4]
MSPEWLYTVVFFAWLAGAAMFVIGLHQMNSPATARGGNRVSALGMTIAVGTTLLYLVGRPEGLPTAAWIIILVGFLIGGGFGLYAARNVAMTAMPQLVSVFNAVGGGAAALVAIDDYLRISNQGQATVDETIFVVLGAVIGSVTFTGSVIAAGKLQGLISGKPIMIPAGRLVTVALAAVAVASTGALVWDAWQAGGASTWTLVIFGGIVAAGLLFGITMVLPIGGADMPVVISLLNSFTGTAAAMAGFVIGNPVLIIAGALVGAAGGILTKLMADAMNRSIMNIIAGGFGGGEGTVGALTETGGSVRAVTPDDVAIQLAYASSVIIVPGYGLAVAQAQHAVRELAELLEARGVDVKYAIHPVAGRMPGHMNVLLAEANVPYPQLKEMEEINPEFERADVALVIGANDVTNPAARRPGSPVSGMPILDVDHARSIVVIKRSMGRGYAGIDNELYTNPKTGMLFADAKAGLAELISAVKAV